MRINEIDSSKAVILPSPNFDEKDLELVEKALSELAVGLEPVEAETENKLRAVYMLSERSLYSNGIERGKALAQYRAFYAPLGKLSEFLRIVKISRQTAYRLIAKAEAEALGTTKPGTPKEPVILTVDLAVESMLKSCKQIAGRLPLDQRKAALDAVGATIESDTEVTQRTRVFHSAVFGDYTIREAA
jgi:hypothetical protein